MPILKPLFGRNFLEAMAGLVALPRAEPITRAARAKTLLS
jgi:hypothetical protein